MTRTPIRPIFKCIPPPQFSQLKEIILTSFSTIQSTVPPPRFITRKHDTLKHQLVRARLAPTDEQLIDIMVSLNMDQNPPALLSKQIAPLPKKRRTGSSIHSCNNSKCATCKFHLDTSATFTCSKTKISYSIRHDFSCNSKNLIYLITCTRCKKQYVGLTTQQLNTRINHHRSNIRNKKEIYVCIHFNFPDHSVNNMKVQPIDKGKDLQELRCLERFWIKKTENIKTKWTQQQHRF